MIQNSEKQLRKQKSKVNVLEAQIQEQIAKIDQIVTFQSRIEDLEGQNEVQMKEKAAIETERDEMRQYAAELVEKVKKEVEGKQFMIDRRMINTFLV